MLFVDAEISRPDQMENNVCIGYIDCCEPPNEEEGKVLESKDVLNGKSLTCTEYGDDSAIQISEWLQCGVGECKLQRLSLRRTRGNAMSCKGATALADMLATNMSLVELDLANNRIGAEGATRIAQALRSNTFLRSLDLTGPPLPFARTNTLTSNGLLRVGVEGARALGSVIAEGRCGIQSLSLGRNGLGDAGLQALCQGIATSHRLHALDVSCNGIGDAGVPFLLQLLSSPRCALKVLDLTTNRLTPEGAQALAVGVIANTTLRVLCIDEVDQDSLHRLQQAVDTSHALIPASTACKLAFCMAMHPRLGRNSPAAQLDAEACAGVLSMCTVEVHRTLQTYPADNIFRMLELF